MSDPLPADGVEAHLVDNISIIPAKQMVTGLVHMVDSGVVAGIRLDEAEVDRQLVASRAVSVKLFRGGCV